MIFEVLVLLLHLLSFSYWRRIMEVDLIEDLWKNAFKRVFDWPLYIQHHTLFAYCTSLILCIGLRLNWLTCLFAPIILTLLYGVLQDYGYFLEWQKRHGDKTWQDSLDYMKDWTTEYVTVLNFKCPKWYATNIMWATLATICYVLIKSYFF